MTTLTAPTHLETGDLTWHARAACRGLDTEKFFLPDAVRGPKKVARENAAKAVCQGCPVIANCLNWALAVAEPHGVWGGTTPQERDQLTSQALLAG
jgi:WhiB family redox-sensing transcriptional regulator